MYDCGQSLNPLLDVGQVEGAFVMGLGLFLTEDVVFDGTTGDLLSVGTFEYKPPFPLDIPQKMAVRPDLGCVCACVCVPSVCLPLCPVCVCVCVCVCEVCVCV